MWAKVVQGSSGGSKLEARGSKEARQASGERGTTPKMKRALGLSRAPTLPRGKDGARGRYVFQETLMPTDLISLVIVRRHSPSVSYGT